jgi:hypothetical protein
VLFLIVLGVPFYYLHLLDKDMELSQLKEVLEMPWLIVAWFHCWT